MSIVSVSAELLREVLKIHSLISALVCHPTQQQTLYVGLYICLHHDNFILLVFLGALRVFLLHFTKKSIDKDNRDFSLPQTGYKTCHHMKKL